MPQIIKLKRSATPGQVPTTAQLELGEVAINTTDGRFYYKKDDGTASVYELNSRQNEGYFDEYMDFNTTSGIKLPVGTTAQRPSGANLKQGSVRYNATDSTFEGFDGANWGSLGGVKDVDQDTYITTESAPSADEDTFEFYAGGTNIASWNATDLDVNTNFNVDGNTTMNGNVTLGNAPTDTLTIQSTTSFSEPATFVKGIEVPTGAGTSTFNDPVVHEDSVTIQTGQTFTFAGQALSTLADFQVKNESGTAIFQGFVFKP